MTRQPRRQPALPRLLAMAIGALLVASPALAQFAGGARAAGPTPVGIITLQSQEVPYAVTLPGRAAPYEQTEIRPRVEGVVEEILYTAGTRVEAGTVLFRLDSETYATALKAAEASRDSAQASVQAAQATVDRYRKLNGVGVTQADLESAETALAQTRASLSASEAQLQAAQLDLDRVEIRSPITGIAGIAAVSVGALVTANQTTALTTVTRIDPIFVDVAESSARMQRIRSRMESGSLTRGADLDVTLTLETGETYADKGRLVSPGAAVSTTTGTVDFRFEFANPDRQILPGQFLRVQITLGTTQAVLVPQRATSRSADGALTAFVVQDGKARKITLTSNGSWQNAWIVTGGVEAGQSLIVDGLRNLRDGAQVEATPVTIDANGVVTEAPAEAAATPAPAAVKSAPAPSAPATGN